MKESLKVGLLGLGTVGSGVPAILREKAKKINQIVGVKIVVSKALVLDLEKVQNLAEEYDIKLISDFQEILKDEQIDIVVELMGRVHPAYEFILEALKAKKHVVTANKDLIAIYGPELIAVAKEQKRSFYYEAAVAGGIPILRTLSHSLCADGIEEVLGIVNGTTNYILTQMESNGKSYETALASAKSLGFAESDPTNDVDGIDAAYKMVILSHFAYGMRVKLEDVEKEGIRNLQAIDVKMADSLGYVFKLIGRTRKVNDAIDVGVAPILVMKSHPLASVKNEMNAVFMKSTGIGESMYYGPGAGSLPTATSVVADLIEIAKDVKQETFGIPFAVYEEETKFASSSEVFDRYYFNIKVSDREGQLTHLIKEFADVGIKIQQVSQHDLQDGVANVIILTHEASKSQKNQFLKKIAKNVEFELNSVYQILG
ncbi:MAG: homoserine dehydrogenase [Lactobacillales bacterium]|jgi:homoserine dehydrogenase|nr:homoserine dehydrogenase [Lactobacillales bacterium]